jgi:hypothetical protein
MRTDLQRTNRIIELLKHEYLREEAHEPEIGSLWQEGVMARIHESDRSPSAGLVTLMGQLSWRLVPASASLAVALVVLVVRTYLTTDYNLVQLVMSRMEYLMLVRLMGM